MKQILILDHHGIGNVVMSIPLLRALSASGKWEKVTVLLHSPGRMELLKNENFDIEPLFYSQYKGIGGFIRLVSKLRGKIDTVVGLPQVPAFKIRLLQLALGAQYSIGEASQHNRKLLSLSVEKQLTKPILQSQSEIAELLGIRDTLRPPLITILPIERYWARQQLNVASTTGGPIIAIHCSAIEPAKRWAPENFGETIRILAQVFPDALFIALGTDNEQDDSNQAFTVAGKVNFMNGTGHWDIRQSLAILSQADLLISADTGLMHMAAAVGTPTLSIFGPTSPERLAPNYTDGIALKPDLPCQPCYDNRFNRSCHRCADRVSPTEVIKNAEALLRKKLANNTKGLDK